MFNLKMMAAVCFSCVIAVTVTALALTMSTLPDKPLPAQSNVAQDSPVQIPANVKIVIEPPVSKSREALEGERINPTPDPKSKYKVYVPINLDDAFVELKKMLPPKVQKEMQEGAEEEMIQYHMGLGRWMRNNWGLWGGSRLAEYFNNLGIHHPDDMSGIILSTFWRHLNSRPLGLEEKIAYYQAYWRASEEPKDKSCPEDGSDLEMLRTLNERAKDGMPRVIHAAWCKKRKHVWVFEHDKGWYKPGPELQQRIDVD